MKPIGEIFPKKCGKNYTKFGFMKGEQYEDTANTKVTGFLSDFKMPEKRIEIIIREMLVNPVKGFIGYVPKDRSIPENVPPLYISMNADNLARKIIRDPIVYTGENVYTESTIDKSDGSAKITIEPLIYVGHKRVIICASTYLLGAYRKG